MFIIPSELENEAARLGSCTVQHSMTVVMANYGGPSGGLRSGGGSAIWSERGELLVQLEEAGSGIAIAAESETGWRATTVVL